MPRIWQWIEKAQLEWNELKPVLSIAIVIATLLGLVFLQMEERRLGYSILKMSRAYKAKVDERRALEIRLAQATRLEKLENMALNRLTLKRAQSHQVIYLNDAGQPDDPPTLPEVRKSARTAKVKAKAQVREFKISALTQNKEGARP
ncbi:MAG: hypothetical protein KF767_02510 [Bdellovibrionaceae bacterium]|mgnify:CR=1 FL=1|nr:hypothetical protein [Pseudobdellovibrionaceae bacterium]